MKSVKQILEFRKNYGKLTEGEVLAILHSEIFINSDAMLIEWHDLLLFICAFPKSKIVLQNAKNLLFEFEVNYSKKIKSEKFINSGINQTKIRGNFSFTLLRELIQSKVEIEIYHIGAERSIIKEVFSEILPLAAKESFAEHNFSIQKFASNQKTNIKKLLPLIIELFEKSSKTESEKERLFSNLDVYIELKQKFQFARTGNLLKTKTPFYSLNFTKLNSNEGPFENLNPVKLTSSNKNSILLSARLALFNLLRETEPLTYTQKNDVYGFDGGCGLNIYLFGIEKEFRQAFDVYFGFMAYKNGCPYAYGGAWMLGDFARIGLNIFSPYRGGESTRTFIKIMAAYHTIGGIKNFMIEPYQIGKNNPEGIESGAFWFYYKLGFRPMQKELAKLAGSEFQKMQNKKTYKSSFKTLLKLSDSLLLYTLDSGKEPFIFDSPAISTAIGDYFINVKNFESKGLIEDNFLLLNKIKQNQQCGISNELLNKLIRLKKGRSEKEYLNFVCNNFEILRNYFA